MNSLNLHLKAGDKVVFKGSDRVFVCKGGSWGHSSTVSGASLDGRFEGSREWLRMDAMTIDAEATRLRFSGHNGWTFE